ncbi:MAG TPA: redox-sensing transcriptional repressor Rex, partial [Gemmatimonadales bacterium]|nr:redox-sensing transcriptional repressor Rex [Gemmatimonadales bacterium]
DRGFRVTAVYDADPAKVGLRWNGIAVRDVKQLERDLTRDPLDIAILSTPPEVAQEMADRLVRSGIRAILNFAPVQLEVPAGVAVKNVNMALELETLSYALHHR